MKVQPRRRSHALEKDFALLTHDNSNPVIANKSGQITMSLEAADGGAIAEAFSMADQTAIVELMTQLRGPSADRRREWCLFGVRGMKKDRGGLRPGVRADLVWLEADLKSKAPWIDALDAEEAFDQPAKLRARHFS